MPYSGTDALKRKYFRDLQMIWVALLVGQLSFAGVVGVMQFQGFGALVPDMRDVYLVVDSALTFGCLLAALTLPWMMLRKARRMDSGKLEKYRTITIVRFALLEGGVLFSIVSAFSTADYVFLGIAAAPLLYFLMLRPTVDRAVNELALSGAEADALRA
jgi:hypothetical protein